jgi:hypothetical protein
MEKHNLKIGQTVYLKPINNLARRNNEIFTDTVYKLGRKYATIKDNKFGCNAEFDLFTMREKSNYSSDYEVYLTFEDAENSSKQPQERRKTIDLVSSLTYTELLKVQDFIKTLYL